MIKINLLPEGQRVKEVKHINIPYRKIGAAAFLIVLLLAIYNLIVYVRVRSEFTKLQQQWNQLAQKSAQADALENELGSGILAEVDFYDSFVDPPLSTARILNAVSDLIPKTVWLTELTFTRKKKEMTFVVNGSSQSAAGASKLIDIQNFANALKLEMEKYLYPEIQAGRGKKSLKLAVATSSEKTPDGIDITQFTANFETEGASEKK